MSGTPYEAPEGLKSKQKLSVIDVISEGPIAGLVNELNSVQLNRTPVTGARGNVNLTGIEVAFRHGEQDQKPPEGFTGSGAESPVGAEIKHDTPILRTITAREIDRLRLTLGVQGLVQSTSGGDRRESEVQLRVEFMRQGAWAPVKTITITGKTTSQYLFSVVLEDLPPRPFLFRVVRVTPDSTSDLLQNKTLFSSYTELTDIKQGYPWTAVCGVHLDSEQFGSQGVARNYHVRGRIVDIPVNYDPVTRVYQGIWNGAFKTGWTNNPAWCLLDMLTHPRYGIGHRLKINDVDKWALYAIARYCDGLVDDGYGGREPRVTCNAWLISQRKAYDILSDFCSAMRCIPVWNGDTMTFIQDRPADPVWVYTNSNVTGGQFKYSYSALKDRHNAAEVSYVDPLNGWQTSVELVENRESVSRFGRNLLRMQAFGCTSRGQAHRAGLWAITTELLETQLVEFSTGAQGLRHTPGDIIEICDNDYAAMQTGGRILEADAGTGLITLDREITLTPDGGDRIAFHGADGRLHYRRITSQPRPDQVLVSGDLHGASAYCIWGLQKKDTRRRLFRCVSIREKDAGYFISAVQHVPEKEALVDAGSVFDPGDMTAAAGISPPAVQHLVVEVADGGLNYAVTARWDTPRVVRGVHFMLKITTRSSPGNPARVVASETTTRTTCTFHNLVQGDYTLTVRAVNGFGQQGAPASVDFSINTPEPPAFVELEPGFFQIAIRPRLAQPDPGTEFEFWYSPDELAASADITLSAEYLGTGSQWIKSGIRPGHPVYFYVRSVNAVGKSAFVMAKGMASDDAEMILEVLGHKITETELGSELLTKINAGTEGVEEISKTWKSTNDRLNSLWSVKVKQLSNGKRYIAGLGLSMEDSPAGTQSQILMAANNIYMVDPANGNTTPMFYGSGSQIYMNEVFLKHLTAPTITSGGYPPAFLLTPDGRITARNADISGTIRANAGELRNVHILENCVIDGTISAARIIGDMAQIYLLGASLYLPPAPFNRQLVVLGNDSLTRHKHASEAHGSGSIRTWTTTDKETQEITGVSMTKTYTDRVIPGHDYYGAAVFGLTIFPFVALGTLPAGTPATLGSARTITRNAGRGIYEKISVANNPVILFVTRK